MRNLHYVILRRKCKMTILVIANTRKYITPLKLNKKQKDREWTDAKRLEIDCLFAGSLVHLRIRQPSNHPTGSAVKYTGTL